MTATVKYCVICGKPFKPHGTQITCSKSCAAIRNAHMMEIWTREHGKPNRRKKIIDRGGRIVCKVCGRPLRNLSAQCCSPLCEEALNYGDTDLCIFLKEEYIIEAAEREAREARLRARDEAYAKEFPHLVGGSRRGNVCGCGCGLHN